VKNEKAKAEVIQYWMEKAHEALESARSEQNFGRLVFAVNRAYYACFYSASAVLMRLGKRFRKHSGVRGAVHSSLVKSEMLDASTGRFYDLAFKSRQRGDYQELVEFSREEADEILSGSEAFVESMRTLLEKMSQGENG
jgi:uncharacterized protein (UPF0332 family)